MPLKVSARGNRFLNMYQLTRQFRQAIPAAEQAAATVATDVSRARFMSTLGTRPLAPSRPGRPSTGGQFANDIVWVRRNGGKIALDVAKLPIYAFIQEIGTGQTARILNPPGQISVRSQYGRLISANLFWGTGPGGNASRAQTGLHDDQLYYASDLNAKTVAQLRRRRKRIRREIKGKHYIADGGMAGALELRTRLTDEAKRIFR